jgi:hypothetical protein
MPYSVSPIGGLRSNNRRGLAFLERSDDADINAKAVFERLQEKTKRDLRTRFDHWIDGNHHDKYFHGWPGDERYKECFVFKWRKGKVHHRLYGFLINPKPQENPRYQLCVLVSHGTKTEEYTDLTELDGAKDLRAREEVIRAVKRAFPEATEGKRGA